MAESQNTANLRALLNQIEEKITALEGASAALEGVKVNAKSTMDDMDALHIAGQRYDEEYEEEQDGIEACGKKFDKKRSNAKDIIAEKISSLKAYSYSVSFEYMASQAADKAAEALAAANAKRNGGK